MTTAEDIEKAVKQLAASELARFRAWFEVFDAGRFDAAIARDVWLPGSWMNWPRKRSLRIGRANRASCEAFRVAAFLGGLRRIAACGEKARRFQLRTAQERPAPSVPAVQESWAPLVRPYRLTLPGARSRGRRRLPLVLDRQPRRLRSLDRVAARRAGLRAARNPPGPDRGSRWWVTVRGRLNHRALANLAGIEIAALASRHNSVDNPILLTLNH
jgi:hypothetical protein